MIVLSLKQARIILTKSGVFSVSRSGTLEETLCLEIMSLCLRLQMRSRGACILIMVGPVIQHQGQDYKKTMIIP
jgi:hypothetical protein